MYVNWSGSERIALDQALARAPFHLKPPLQAVRDEGCAFVMVGQSRARFEVPADRPAIVLIGDDLAAALGPRGFHDRSLRRYLARCRAVSIVAVRAAPVAYLEASAWAVRRRECVAIVETRPEREADWLAFVRGIDPAIEVLVATPAPEGSA